MEIAIGATNINDIKLGTNQISKVYVGSVQVWEKQSAIPNWFYVEDVSGQANTLRFAQNATDVASPAFDIYTSTDGVSWTNIGQPTNNGLTATVDANSKLYIRAATSCWGKQRQSPTAMLYVTMSCGSNFKVGGNIMSLLYGSSFTGTETTFPTSDSYTFYHLFENVTTLTDASDLVLPAATLTDSCYDGMFYGCTGLVNAPAELPALTSAGTCYTEMFSGCTSMTTAPEIQITDITGGASCLNQMFYGCSSLSAITIHEGSNWDGRMFSRNWVTGVAASGTFTMPASLDGMIPLDDDSGVPTGWTVVLT